MQTAEGTAVQQSIPDLIAGDRYQSVKAAGKRGFTFGGARFAQAVGPPQCNSTPTSLNDTGGDGF